MVSFTSSAVVMDVQMHTSADDGKGKSESFMYSDKTVFKTSPKSKKSLHSCLHFMFS